MNPFRTSGFLVHGVVVAALATACTAARTGIELQSATEAKAIALDKRAPELAPYEWSMASHYLVKAWEEAGHGEHRTSVQLAKKSQEWTDQALVEIGRGPRRLDIDEESLQPPVMTRPTALPEPVPEPKSLASEDDLEMEGL